MTVKLDRAKVYRVIVDDENIELVKRCKPANDFFGRLKGLMFREKLDDEEALVILPCNSVHTFFMRFPIDLVFVDREMKVVGDRRNVMPGKVLSPVNDAWAVIELKGGRMELIGIRDSISGRKIRFEALEAA